MKKIYGLPALCILILFACNNHYRYFTQKMYDEFRWSDAELESIQFYVSEDIVLFKRLSAEDARISNGKIRVIDGSKVEEVIIEKGTPGVFVQSPKKNRFAIAFEDDESKFLMFGPNAKYKDRYVLLGKEWEKRWGKITYGGETYETSSRSAYASLMVDIKKAQNTNYQSRKAKGNRVE